MSIMQSNQRWHELVDESISADRSLLLRYRAVLALLEDESRAEDQALAETSLGEGARVFEFARHRGVEILVCDESSLMRTGTYKDLDACLTVARCRQDGIPACVVSSGGNLGRALAHYGHLAPHGPLSSG